MTRAASAVALAMLLAGAPNWEASRSVLWVDDGGKTVVLSQWLGEPLVVTVFYSTCEVRCPRVVSKLQSLDKELQRHGIEAHFALVTLNPEADSAARLRDYRAAHGLDGTRWHLLRGSPAQTDALSRLLSVHALEDGSHLAHDSRIAVFDAGGRLQRLVEGWSFSDLDVVSALEAPTR